MYCGVVTLVFGVKSVLKIYVTGIYCECKKKITKNNAGYKLGSRHYSLKSPVETGKRVNDKRKIEKKKNRKEAFTNNQNKILYLSFTIFWKKKVMIG